MGKHVAPKKSKHPVLKFGAGLLMASMAPPKAKSSRSTHHPENHQEPRPASSFGGRVDRWKHEIAPPPRPAPGVPMTTHIAMHPNPLGVLYKKKCGHPHSQPVGIDRWDQMLWSKAETTVVGVGPARALGGKSASLAMPALMLHNGPAIVVSQRDDALLASVAIRSMLGEVFMFDPDGMGVPDGVQEVRWSLLTGAKDLDLALKTARATVKTAVTASSNGTTAENNAHFHIAAGTILGLLCYWGAWRGKSWRDVHRIITVGTKNEFEKVLHDLADFDDPRAFEILMGVLSQPGERELGSFKTTLSNALAGYQTEAARASADNPNFDAAEFVTADPKAPNPWLWDLTSEQAGFGEGKTLYLIQGDNEEAAAINASIITQCIHARHKLYRTDQLAGNVNAHADLLIVLDEMAQTPLPDLPKLLAMPGRGCLFNGQLQDLTQLKKWGPLGETMVTQMQQLIVFNGERVMDTLKLIESLCPTEPTERITAHNPGQGTMLTANASPERVPGIPMHQVYSGISDDPTVKLFLGADGRQPEYIHVMPYYSDPILLFGQVAMLEQMANYMDPDDPRRLLPLPDLDNDGTGSYLTAAGGPELLDRWNAVCRSWAPQNPYEEATVEDALEQWIDPYAHTESE